MRSRAHLLSSRPLIGALSACALLVLAACPEDEAAPDDTTSDVADGVEVDTGVPDGTTPDGTAPDGTAPDGEDVAEVEDDTSVDADEGGDTEDDTSGDVDDGGDSEDDTSALDTETDGDDSDACVPSCADVDACGDDGCGGSCGGCDLPSQCLSGVCVAPPDCLPDCGGKECGGNSCGGSCGTCLDPLAPLCDDGICVAPCVPDCRHRSCGDDGCGASCGSCGADEVCADEGGFCVPSSWTCSPLKYGVEDQCDCDCGTADPDCDLGTLATLGCGEEDRCEGGACVPRVPLAWTCDAGAYGNGGACQCDCGVPDPDCDDAAAPLVGCDPGEVCTAGACAPCVGSCTGKVCGDDGCGVSCGECGIDDACVAGACVNGCVPVRVVCQTAECGDDGCGGSCGDCGAEEVCLDGLCETIPGSSCVGICKGEAPNGCSCEEGCELGGTCCPDYVPTCVCIPDCGAKTCGNDGCGGSCGACDADPDKPYCGADFSCTDVCFPQCDGKACGDDGCGGECGACADEASCNVYGECVPAEWSCLDIYYGEHSACDCACGAPDPDCDVFALTFGCPYDVGCTDTGLCDVAQCNTHDDCTPPKWCFGHYPAGGGLRKGVCQVPEPAGEPDGFPCIVDADCAGGLCAASYCRSPCGQDGDCLDGEVCIGVPIVDWLSLLPLGVVAVCDEVAALGDACDAQADCAEGAMCLVTTDQDTLAPAFRCGTLPSPSLEGAFCSGPSCATGLVCADELCARPCPGGDADCPDGQTCGSAVLHGGTSASASDDVTVPACVVP